MNGRGIECLINEKPALMKKTGYSLKTNEFWQRGGMNSLGFMAHTVAWEKQGPSSSHTLGDPLQISPSL